MNDGFDDYIACALWSSHDYPPGVDPEDPDAQQVPLDEWDDDLCPSCREQLCAEYDDFMSQERVIELIEQTGMSMEQAAHDFWLTRNRHGAGFWDRGLGAAGDELSALCKPYGTCDLYIGDDGRIHL